MKRIIAAVSFAAFAVPALAVEHGKPYEQTEVDRALPQIKTAAPADKRSTESRAQSHSSQSPWASDWNFIAPAP